MLFTVIIYWITGLRSAMNALGLTLLVVVFTINVSTACGKCLVDPRLYDLWIRNKRYLDIFKKY